MNLFSPTYLKTLCTEYSLTPSKKYGQNYLISGGVMEKIIASAEIKKSDIVIEIGPGFGVLSFALAERAKKVFSFEIEKKLKTYWDEKAPENLEIIWGNALKELPDFLKKNKIKKFKVVANLPYQITSLAIRTILELEQKPEKIVLMLQREVAQRIIAKKGDTNLLSLSVNFFGEPKIVSKVPANCFWPKPKVDSAILKIENIKERENQKEFFVLARAGFSQKRKQLWKNLRSVLDLEDNKIKEILKDVSDNENVRAENLSFKEWVNLSQKFV